MTLSITAIWTALPTGMFVIVQRLTNNKAQQSTTSNNYEDGKTRAVKHALALRYPYQTLDTAPTNGGRMATKTARPAVDVGIEPLFLDVKTTQRLLGNISRTKLNELIRDGRITPHTIDGRVVFTPDEVRRFAATCPSWEPRP